MNYRKLLCSLAAATCVFLSSASAQTTHTVIQSGFNFVPDTLTIAPGDTVEWVWGTGSHTVTSGTPCTSDGLFDMPLTSGNPLPSFTFDCPGSYDYFCIPHCGLGMDGVITVSDVVAVSTVRIGSGVNPSTYSQVTPPVINTSWNTTVSIGSIDAVASIVSVSLGGPTQISLGIGELLCLPPLSNDTVFGSAHSIPIPNDCTLLGLSFCTQGASIELSPFSIQLNNAIDITIGSM